MTTPLTWISAQRRSGGDWMRFLLACYQADAPVSEITTERMLGLAPDLMSLYQYGGRMVPFGRGRPLTASTYLLPGTEVMQVYRDEPCQVLYLVRDPRDILTSLMRAWRVPPEDRAHMAELFVSYLGSPDWEASGRGNWPLHAAEWTVPERVRRHLPKVREINVLRFEELRADPAAALRRVLGYVGAPGTPDPDRLDRAVKYASPEELHKAEAGQLINSFREPIPEPQARPAEPLTLADLGPRVEKGYRRRVAEDAQFAGLLRRFGYED